MARAAHGVTGKKVTRSHAVPDHPATIRLPNNFCEGEKVDRSPRMGRKRVPNAELFQPGEPDEGAREHAYKFAKANGCAINNKWTGEIVFFVKPKPATA